jgi:plasmid stabilization system protein ParE
MPTFSNPVEDAADAREAVRALAHASRAFADPADTYQVVGELLGTLRSLEQVLEQVAAAHVLHQDKAFLDNGDHEAGVDEAWAAANALRRAAELVQSAETAVDQASQHSSYIAWHPAPVASRPELDPFSRDPFEALPVSSRRGLSL